MEILIGLVLFVLAVLLGAWRQKCAVYEVHWSYNCPSAWRSSMVKMGTWIIVALFALAGSFILSTWIVDNIGDLIGRFSFGVLLVVRWTLSFLFGSISAHNKIPKQ